MHKQLVTVALVGLLVATHSIAEKTAIKQGRSIDYIVLNQRLNLFKNKVRSHYIIANTSIVIKENSIKPKDISIWLTENNKIIKTIKIAENGHVDLPVFSDHRAEKIQIHFSHSKDQVALNLTTSIKPPIQTEISYKELFIVLDDFNDFAGQMAGMSSWLISDMDALKFTFEGPSSITIKTKSNSIPYETDADHSITIDKDKSLMSQDAKVIFSQLPKAMIPQD